MSASLAFLSGGGGSFYGDGASTGGTRTVDWGGYEPESASRAPPGHWPAVSEPPGDEMGRGGVCEALGGGPGQVMDSTSGYDPGGRGLGGRRETWSMDQVRGSGDATPCRMSGRDFTLGVTLHRVVSPEVGSSRLLVERRDF